MYYLALTLIGVVTGLLGGILGGGGRNINRSTFNIFWFVGFIKK